MGTFSCIMAKQMEIHSLDIMTWASGHILMPIGSIYHPYVLECTYNYRRTNNFEC